jgi:hypothetical protein
MLRSKSYPLTCNNRNYTNIKLHLAAFITKLKSSLIISDKSINETMLLIDLGVNLLIAVKV